MGVAIVEMHYTGMAAAIFTPADVDVDSSFVVAEAGLGFGVGIITLIILGIALASSAIGRGFSVRAAELKEMFLEDANARLSSLREALEGRDASSWSA